ncbi:LacI family DNA-binding transcriptional regulator [Reinekea sp.]|uniref:LacI family DNA-binding transcriptional regulator n=1 Tax=Reinekea sp. TaxID=1970455 RepID=UPI002A819916|nr:LacI family DNA-binding transcriptional regulator [Reinekea sp.]
MTTIKEVSELAGVSQATVSRVMNSSERVADATRQKVKAAMADLGYQPNSAAQSLASNRSNTIGMVVSSLDGPFYGPVMSGVEEELRGHNKHLIIASGHGQVDQEKEAISFLSSRQVDGLILLTESVDAAYLKNLNDRIPIYLINQHIDGLENRNMWLDNEGGCYAATQYLLAMGHTQIVCAGGQSYKQDANERVAGFTKAMREAGLAVSVHSIVRTMFEFAGGLEAMRQLAASGLPFTAIVAGNDEMAIGIFEWAAQHKIRIPEDLSVIGFDDVLMANYVKPRLTTMNFPVYEMARASARMALDEVYSKRPPQGMEFKPNLVTRDSVRDLNA